MVFKLVVEKKMVQARYKQAGLNLCLAYIAHSPELIQVRGFMIWRVQERYVSLMKEVSTGNEISFVFPPPPPQEVAEGLINHRTRAACFVNVLTMALRLVSMCDNT